MQRIQTQAFVSEKTYIPGDVIADLRTDHSCGDDDYR
jgi:hypothetical protein